MYAVAARLDPDSLLALARAALRRDGAGRGHLRGRVPLPAPRTGRTPVRRPERDVGGARAGRRARPASGSPCSTPSTWPAGSPPAGTCPLDEVQQRFSDGSVDALGRPGGGAAAAPGAAGRRGGALGARGAARGALAEVRAAVGEPAAARAPVRAAGGERGVPGLLRLHADPAAGRRRAARPRDHRRARHPPDRRRRRPARRLAGRRSARARPPRPTSPTASARSAGWPTRAPRCASAPTSTPSSTCSPRPGRWSSASGWRTGERGRFTPAELTAALTAAGHPALGWPDAGRLEVGARADLVAVALDTPRTAGCDPAQVVMAAGRGRRAHRRRRRAGRGARRAARARATSAGCWPTRSGRW